MNDNADRFVVLPIKHHKIWNMYQKAKDAFWTEKEIDLDQDVKDWKDKLNDGDRSFIKTVLAFFAASDGIVNENLAERFYGEVQIPEARMFYGCQIFIEGIHAHVYSLLIDTYVKDPKEKDSLFKAVHTNETIKKKAHWALKWTQSKDQPYRNRLVAYACVEGIFFSASFCSIFWLKKRNLMPGLCFSNELISRDEGLHTDFAVLQLVEYNMISDTNIVLNIVIEAVNIEKEFVNNALAVNLIGMNAGLMSQYVEFVADRLLVSMGLSKHYNASNPFTWMELISLKSKGNFFEKRIGDYQQPGQREAFTTNEDF